jgi:hypothetical protein
VAVPPDRDDQPVREFKSFTEDLEQLADWLVRCGVDIVAMESTGVYWIPLFELLEARGLTVYLVNARHVKNVSGRKSDVLDCQWLQQLMSYGLLSGAFRPKDEICALRAVSRQRDMLLSYQARHVQHMQKALALMNVQLANVISDNIIAQAGQEKSPPRAEDKSVVLSPRPIIQLLMSTTQLENGHDCTFTTQACFRKAPDTAFAHRATPQQNHQAHRGTDCAGSSTR